MQQDWATESFSSPHLNHQLHDDAPDTHILQLDGSFARTAAYVIHHNPASVVAQQVGSSGRGTGGLLKSLVSRISADGANKGP